MPKVLVEFDSIEQAQAAIFAVSGQQAAAPAPAFMPNVAAPMPAPAPMPQAAPMGFPPAPQAGVPFPAPAPAAIPAAQAAPAPAASQYTAAQCASALQSYAQKHSPKGAKALLQQFGIDSVNKLDPSQYANFLQAAAV
jgi:hypothetical protein